jgi:hypothetical protein
MEVIIAMIGNVKLAMPGLVRTKTEAQRRRKEGSTKDCGICSIHHLSFD